MGSEEKEEVEKEEDEEKEEKNKDRDEARDFSDDCALASCVTTASDSESGTLLPLDVVRLPSSLSQSNASEFSVGG